MKIKPFYGIIGVGLLALVGGLHVVGIEAGKAESAVNNPEVVIAKMENTTPAKTAADSLEKVAASRDYSFKKVDAIPLDEWQQFKLREIAENNGIPFVLALGVIEIESNFDPNDEYEGCYGLMQVSGIHAPKSELLDPVTNMRYGCHILGAFYKKYKDWNKALTCYNRGERGAEGLWSTEYSRRVLLASEKWARTLGERSVLNGD